MQENLPKIYIYKRIVQAKLFIDEHFCENLNINSIADEAYFSKFHFIRLFKSIYQKTPHQYLIKVRVENAKLLLQKGYTVSDTCFNVGFDSVNSFSLLFKQNTKTTPAVYREFFMKRQQLIKQQPLRFIPNCFALQNGWL